MQEISTPMFHVKRRLVQEKRKRNKLSGHGLGQGAGICPVDPMILMIALLLNWLGGIGLPPGSGVGPTVCTAPNAMRSPDETIHGAVWQSWCGTTLTVPLNTYVKKVGVQSSPSKLTSDGSSIGPIVALPVVT